MRKQDYQEPRSICKQEEQDNQESRSISKHEETGCSVVTKQYIQTGRKYRANQGLRSKYVQEGNRIIMNQGVDIC